MSRETRETEEFDPMIGADISKKEQEKSKKPEDFVLNEGEGGAFPDLEAFKKAEQKKVYDAEKEEKVPFKEIPFSGHEAEIILEKSINENDIEAAKSIGVPIKTIKENRK